MFGAHAVTEEQACAQPCARPCAKPYAQPCAEPYANAKPFARPCAKLFAQPCAEPYANAKPCGPTCSQPYAEPCAPAGAQPGAAQFATSPAGKSQNESCVGVSLRVFGSQGTLKSLSGSPCPKNPNLDRVLFVEIWWTTKIPFKNTC